MKKYLTKINKDIFTVSLVTFVILFFAETIKPKFVIAYIDLNKVLLLTFISGLIFVVTSKPENNEQNEPIKSSHLLIFGILTFLFIVAFSKNLGYWSILLGLGGGCISFFLGKTLNTKN